MLRHPREHKWFVVVDGQDYGPYTRSDLQHLAGSGRLESEHELRRDDSQRTKPAEEIPWLAECFCSPDLPDITEEEFVPEFDENGQRLLPEGVFPFTKGDVLPDLPYRLVAGRRYGGYRQVWRAEHIETHQSCILKFFLDEPSQSGLRQARPVLEQLKQRPLEGFAKIYDLHEKSLFPCLASECVAGADLEWVTSARFNSYCEPFSLRDAAEMIYELAIIVSRAHSASLVHRNLTPMNIVVAGKPPHIPVCNDHWQAEIQKRKANREPKWEDEIPFLDSDGPYWKFKIVDLGLGAMSVEELRSTRASHMKCSTRLPTFISVEECQPNHVPDRSDDVHALGVLWLHLIVGNKCWDEPPPSHNPHYDFSRLEHSLCENGFEKEQAALLMSCIKPHKFRPADAQVLTERLQKLYGFD